MVAERIVAVHNPASTRSRSAVRELASFLDGPLSKGTFVATPSPSFETNVEFIAEQIQDGDTILSIGGDGTHSQVANAVLREQHEHTKIGMLGYGNFNDLSGGRNPHDFLHKSTRSETFHPLTVDVDGHYWRDAPAYVSLGWSALLASEFSANTFRTHLGKFPQHLIFSRSLAHVGFTYAQALPEVLPPFHRDLVGDKKIATTDVFAFNSRRAGKLIRIPTSYGHRLDFGYTELRLTSHTAVAQFAAMAMSGRLSLDNTNDTGIFFGDPVSLPIQTEGETQLLKDVSCVRIYKDSSKLLTILRP